MAEVGARGHAAAAVRAAEVAQAALHLKLASDELEEARRLIDASEADKALLTLERATVDAELARLLHEEAAARDRAHDAVRKLEHVSRIERGAKP